MADVRVGLIFIDGFGLGEDRPDVNPLAAESCFFTEWLGVPLTINGIGDGLIRQGLTVKPTDALLGVAGLPQSATGQTSLFSGVNAQKVIGRHLNGFPSLKLRRILRDWGVFARLARAGLRAVFANAFTDGYFAAVEAGKWRHSASTVAALAGDQPLRNLEDLRQGRAVYQDITRELLIARGCGDRMEPVRPEQAGRHLAGLIREYDFTLFEYFQTDRCGHKQDREWAGRILNELGGFIRGALEELPERETLLLICSDHGNFEALDSKTHTANPVPTVAWGSLAGRVAGVKSLTDVLPLVLEILGVENRTPLLGALRKKE